MLLLKEVQIIDNRSSWNGQTVDIYIKDGKIDVIGQNLNLAATKVFEGNGAVVSIGWFDLGTQVGDPGFEHREDVFSVSNAAAAGGFTAIACLPNTHPTIHSKSEVLYIKNRTRGNIVDFYPIGAISEDCKGKDLAELFDMQHHGAVAFSDGRKSVQNNGLMLRALLYTKPFDGLIINHPHDKDIASGGIVHEGVMSTSLGMKGIPSLAEEMMIQRDLHLVEYAETKIHFANISTKGSVELIRNAKNKGLKITASVNPMNLFFTDEVLVDFESNYKVVPPLRAENDRQALIEGLKDGTIDLIETHHVPQEIESKDVEFSYSNYGVIMLETAFSIIQSVLKDTFTTTEIIEKIAIAPRNLLQLELPTIEVGSAANLTIFNPNEKWTFEATKIQSKSKNSPFIGQQLTGKVLGIVNNSTYLIR
jgi:dihydroorotase